MKLTSLVSSVLCTMFLSSLTTAQISTHQVGGDLFVSGTERTDVVHIDCNEGNVSVFDFLQQTTTFYTGVFKVWVDTGNGNDFVALHSSLGPDICIVSGNGDDGISCQAASGGSLAIDAGNGKDTVSLIALGNADLDVRLGTGKDRMEGLVTGNGTIDGGEGQDECSDVRVIGGGIVVVNCES